MLKSTKGSEQSRRDAPQKPYRPSPSAESQRTGFRRPALPDGRARGRRDGEAWKQHSKRNYAVETGRLWSSYLLDPSDIFSIGRESKRHAVEAQDTCQACTCVLTRTSHRWCAPKIIFHKKRALTRTRFTKRDARARRGVAGGGGGARVSSFYAESLSETKRAHLISCSNSLPASSMGLNFSPIPLHVRTQYAPLPDGTLRF